MRFVTWLLLLLLSGCANTVYRMEGNVVTPGGSPKGECENEGWLTVAPSRADIADPESKLSHPEDGVSLYPVGEDKPENILDHEATLGPSPIVDRKQSEMVGYDKSKRVAGVLGGLALAAMAVGTVLFVTAFESTTVDQGNGTTEETQSVNGTRAGIGGGVVASGFAFGIAGLAVNPSHAERTRANATRYAFLSRKDDPKKVQALAERHNSNIRRRCEARGEM